MHKIYYYTTADYCQQCTIRYEHARYAFDLQQTQTFIKRYTQVGTKNNSVNYKVLKLQ